MAKVVHVDSGPIGRTLFAFALPVLLSQMLQELYNAADCAVLGHFGESGALAASGIAGLLLSVFINFFIGFSSGISAVTARLFGQYDYVRLRRAMSSVFRLVLAAGFVFSVTGLIAAEGFLRLLRCPPEVLPIACRYLRICVCGVPAQLFYNVGTAVLRSLGNTKAPLRCYAVSCLCNLSLDLLLVIGFRLGVAGAAAATLFAQWLLAALLLRRLLLLGEDCSLRLLGEGLKVRELGAILRVGIPSGLQALFMSISSLLIQRSINSFGPDAMAGMTLYAKVEGLLYLPSFSYGIALTGFVGQNLGAERLDRVKESVAMSLRTMWATIFPLSLVITGLSPILLRAFTHDPEILFNAHEAILFNLPVYIVYAMNQVWLGAVKGFGKTGFPMLCTLLCYSIFRVVWCHFLIPVFATMRVVYLSYDVSFFLMMALILTMYRHLVRAQEQRAAS